MFTTFWVNLTQKIFHPILTPKKTILGHFWAKNGLFQPFSLAGARRGKKCKKSIFGHFQNLLKIVVIRSNGQKMLRNTSFES